jgi:hypothetical protein
LANAAACAKPDDEMQLYDVLDEPQILPVSKGPVPSVDRELRLPLYRKTSLQELLLRHWSRLIALCDHHRNGVSRHTHR